jgi:Ser/Thr protein kinase RdoA (MazF antagonist)
MTDHSQRIRQWLARLGQAGDDHLEYEVLQGGISGAYTYLVDFGTGPKGLKLTEATSAPGVLQRAQRELLFYRELAPQVPLQVPQLLASYTDDTGASALLFVAYRPPEPPDVWQEAHYWRVAQQLASFHARFWDKAEKLDPYPWLKRVSPDGLERHLPQAQAAWQALFEQPRFAEIFTAHTRQMIARLLPQVQALSRRLAAFPLTLCHGDCHMGNLLHDQHGKPVWADWQEVSVGCGPEDLAFFLQRAQAAGGSVPYASAAEAYQEELERLGMPVTLEAVRRVVAVSELCTRLVHWPGYLSQASPQQVADHLERINVLAQDL